MAEQWAMFTLLTHGRRDDEEASVGRQFDLALRIRAGGAGGFG